MTSVIPIFNGGAVANAHPTLNKEKKSLRCSIGFGQKTPTGRWLLPYTKRARPATIKILHRFASNLNVFPFFLFSLFNPKRGFIETVCNELSAKSLRLLSPIRMQAFRQRFLDFGKFCVVLPIHQAN